MKRIYFSQYPSIRECTSEKYGFSYMHKISEKMASSSSHVDKDLVGIYMLISGDVDFVIEGKRYHLEPNDIVLINNNERHHSVVGENTPCEFILLLIDIDFFIKNDCTDFAGMVFNRMLGTNNIISGKRAVKDGIYDIFMRLERYTGEENVCLPVVKSVITELLYNLNRRFEKTSASGYGNNKAKEIVEFINDNLTEELSLDLIAERFFITKPYLCRMFREQTGFTIKRYIQYKRIVMVRELCFEGMPVGEACLNAGFNSYSGFYRAYVKIMNESPGQRS